MPAPDPTSGKAVIVNDVGAAACIAEMRTGGTADSGDVASPDGQHLIARLGGAQVALEPALIDREILFSPQDRVGALLQSFWAERARDGDVPVDDVGSGAVEVRFDRGDRKWLGMAIGWLREELRLNRFDFLPPPPEPDRLPNATRVAVLGDWGTGLYGAPVVAQSITDDPTGFDAVVHLGDVYYAGTPGETEERFLDLWPSPHPAHVDTVLSRGCNGNHEMYSGGYGYRDGVLKAFGQSSSVFALENDFWLLIGLDTAYDNGELNDEQLDWLRARMTATTQRVVLFSHHYPFSAFDPEPTSTFAQLGKLLVEFPDKVAAWYWGHEHHCALHEPHDVYGFSGRCIGHSGFPYLRTDARFDTDRMLGDDGTRLVRAPGNRDAPPALVLDGPNPYVGSTDAMHQRYGPNGYVTLDLDGSELRERVLDPEGKTLWEHTIST